MVPLATGSWLHSPNPPYRIKDHRKNNSADNQPITRHTKLLAKIMYQKIMILAENIVILHQLYNQNYKKVELN